MNKRLMLSPTLCHEYILGNKCIAQFAYLKHLYRIEGGKPLKVAHALKKVSLNHRRSQGGGPGGPGPPPIEIPPMI